jgi:hypothetical protein
MEVGLMNVHIIVWYSLCLCALLICSCKTHPEWSGDRYVECEGYEVRTSGDDERRLVSLLVRRGDARTDEYELRLTLDGPGDTVVEAVLMKSGVVVCSYDVEKYDLTWKLSPPEEARMSEDFTEAFLVRVPTGSSLWISFEVVYPSAGANRSVWIVSTD